MRAPAALLVGLLLPAAAMGQGDDATRHFEEGVGHLEAQRHADAVVAFQRSLQAREAAGTLYNLALALRGLNRCLEAEAALTRQAAIDANPERRAAGEGLLSEARRCIGALSLTVVGRPDELLLDGVPLALGEGIHTVRVDPGPHNLRARREGYRASVDTVEVPRGGRAAMRADVSIALRGTLSVETTTPAVAVRIDAAPVAPDATRAEVDAGRHTVEVWFAGEGAAQRREVEVPPGGRAVVSLAPSPRPVARAVGAPPVYTRWWFWAVVGGGVTAAALGVAAAAGAFETQTAPHAGPDGWAQVPFGVRFP